MSIIKWKECYQTKIVALDKEHQQLLEVINRLYLAIKERRVDDVMLSIFDELIVYTELHFAHEERLLAEHNYAGLAVQQEQHQKLIQDVCAYRSRLQAGEKLSAAEVMKFLRGWLLEHIVEYDLQYSAYLESRGGRFLA